MPGDCPFLPKDLVTRLHEARVTSNVPLACARSGEWRHPVVGLWPVRLREDLRHALVSEGLHKIELWTARHGIAIAEWPAAPIDPFFNVNTPKDAAQAEAIAAQISGRVTVLFALRRRQPGHRRAALGFKSFDRIAVFQRDVDVVDAAHQAVLAQRADVEAGASSRSGAISDWLGRSMVISAPGCSRNCRHRSWMIVSGSVIAEDAVLDAVPLEDFAKARSDQRAKAEIHHREGRTLARRAAAEIPDR